MLGNTLPYVPTMTPAPPADPRQGEPCPTQLRDKLVEQKSFKKLGDEFIAALREFKANWSA